MKGLPHKEQLDTRTKSNEIIVVSKACAYDVCADRKVVVDTIRLGKARIVVYHECPRQRAVDHMGRRYGMHV